LSALDGQIRLGDIDPDYKAFIDKFKLKKTTDDCYTPQPVYDVILAWAAKEYGFDPAKAVRPFWPGADYEEFDYPPGCVVVDNPPFSIVSQICRKYVAAGIRFFLFTPYLTAFTSCPDAVCHVITGASIEYENGAVIDTAFATNLEPDLVARTAPELMDAIDEAVRKIRAEKTVQLPKYKYPVNVLTAAMMGYMAKHGAELKVRRSDAVFIRKLDAQQAQKKVIFGGGYLLSEKAAAEKAAAEKAAAEKAAAEKAAAIPWELSEREKRIIREMGRSIE